jgi:hypothetical protein
MVVNHFDFVGIAIAPLEANSPLIVHTNAPLTSSFTVQLLKSIRWRNSEVGNAG